MWVSKKHCLLTFLVLLVCFMVQIQYTAEDTCNYRYICHFYVNTCTDLLKGKAMLVKNVSEMQDLDKLCIVMPI